MTNILNAIRNWWWARKWAKAFADRRSDGFFDELIAEAGMTDVLTFTMDDLVRGGNALRLWRRWLDELHQDADGPWLCLDDRGCFCVVCQGQLPNHEPDCLYAAAATLFPGEYES